MFHDRFKKTLWLAFAVVLMVAVPVLAADGEKADEKKKPQAAPAAKAAPAATAGKGVILRPKVVDGSVSAYAGAVRQADPAVKVYTNADLESMWAGDTRPWATVSSGVDEDESEAGGASLPTPLDWMETQAASAQERAKSIADAERELAEAKSDVANLEKQLRAVTNPLSARPKLSDDEKAARAAGETVPLRKQRNEEQLEQARKRLREAQARLDQARRSR